ncbi:MAG: ATP-grasp domain-containing protein [Planctomycetaceae bacterium]|nr:ATP-grasp domain-containing protein [Planctomycetaceae bacterium]
METHRAILDVLADRWWIAALSFGVALVATPLMRLIAHKTRIVDRPDELLKPHGRPVAYLGGVAICLGLLSGLLAHLLTRPGGDLLWARIAADLGSGNVRGLISNPFWNLLGIAAGAIVITLVGLLDDIKNISPRKKVYGQTLAAGLMLAGGVGTRMITIVTSQIGITLPLWLTIAVSAVMCVMLVIATCNATNLLDGLDGLCGGVTGIIAVGFVVLAAWLGAWGHSPINSPLRLTLCVAMAGAVLGFLPHNVPPASIFMGDAGSMLLGFFVAAMMALFSEEGNPRWFIAACGIFALPIIDTGLAVVRRLLSGKSIFAGDRSHLYDQLIDRGMSVRQVVGLFYLLAAVAATLAVSMGIFLRMREAVPIYAVVIMLISYVLYRMGMVRPQARKAGLVGIELESKRMNLLFTSAGRRVSLLHEFQRAAHDLGLRLEIHAADMDPMAPALQIADRQLLVPHIGHHEYTQRLSAYCRDHKIHAVIPLIDTDLSVMSASRQLFEQAGTRAIISSQEVVKVACDKLLTCRFLQDNGFLTPRVLTADEVAAACPPLFIKPRFGSASLGAHKILTNEDLAYYRHKNPDSVVQELIEGQEYTVDVFTDLSGRSLCAVPRQRLEVRGGEVTKSKTVRHEEIIRQSRRLVDCLAGCVGMITIQCFLTPDNRVVFIEINPRFGGGVPLSIVAGADSPRWLLELLLGRTPTIHSDAWQDNLVMLRYMKGLFVPQDQLAATRGGSLPEPLDVKPSQQPAAESLDIPLPE